MQGIRTRVGLAAVCWLLLSAGLLQAADPEVIESEQQRIAVVEKVSPSVVAIFASGGGGGGSGVTITPDGYVLTNFHVIQGAGNFMKCGLNDGVLYDAVIVGIDPTGDVAMIKLLGRDDFPHATLGDSDKVQLGDWAFAMGNPFLLATDFHPTITYGIVSGVHRYQYPAGTILEYTDCIQVDSSINPGNSGGPLFNADGELIGINGRGSFEKRGRVNVGAGYAISINQIKHFMDHLRSGRVVDHATLGATVSTDDKGAVIVSNILEDSQVSRRGLRMDDEIVSFAGRPIGSVNQFKNVLGIYPNGWKLPLVYRREGQKTEIMVRLPRLHQKSELTLQSQKEQPQQPDPRQPKNPKTPDGKPPKGPPRPQQKPKAKAPPPPAQYAKLYVEKAGFANYYFNQQEQNRLLKSVSALGDFSKRNGLWKMSGKFNGEVPFEFRVADKGAGVNLGKQTFFQPFQDLQELQDEPPGTGGLLVAMQHLRILLSQGPKGFSEFYYVGSEPWEGRGELVDVLHAELSGAVSRWYFNRKDGSLLGFDLGLTEDADPCEVRFSQFAEFSGVKLPVKFSVKHADTALGDFVLENFSATERVPDPNPGKPAASNS